MKIDEIHGETPNLELKVKILSLSRRETTTSRGETVYYYGLVGDETGVLPYTAWEFPAPIKAGDTVQIKYARSRVYNERIRLYFDSKTEILLKPGEDIEVKRTYKETKLMDLSLKNPFVTVTGKISNMAGKEYSKAGNTFTIYNGFIEDDTSRVRISSFGQPLENGKIYRLVGARVSEFNKQLEISIGDKTEVYPENEDMDFERYYKLFEVDNPAGGITILGFIITLGTKSGIIKRCSECNKPLSTGVCPDHPDKPTKLDIFSYFTLDDGTRYIQCIAGKKAVMPFLGIKEEDLPRVAGDIYRMLEDRLYGHAVRVNADFIKNEDDLSLRVNAISAITREDIEKDIKVSQ
ncbi:replication protein A [Ferroplasma sp.]|uniref:replication protein A n=1 Tax=Ferroplasma sp. TaxID=2591003 RepID=UPI002629A113|nr:replication protein A [Ferroplasma sp.]MCL4453512.1 replication protein A [Candidatus Thermoplasmatota archaeon]